MEVCPLAFDSMGARGMSCLVRTDTHGVLIDPGVNLAPRRHKLPPHPLEEEKKGFLWGRIEGAAREADVIILTHYHYDHLNPDGYHVFYNKTVLLKNPDENLNYNQRRRASLLLDHISCRSRKVVFADGVDLELGNLRLRFSRAVPHGMDTRRGCVVQVLLEEGDFRFLFTSDIEGANLDDQLEFIVSNDPELILLDGPAITFPQGRSHRIGEIIKKTKVRTIIVDHHLMREKNWRDFIKDGFDVALQKGVRLVSAAEYGGEEENLLEARRVELYRESPVS